MPFNMRMAGVGAHGAAARALARAGLPAPGSGGSSSTGALPSLPARSPSGPKSGGFGSVQGTRLSTEQQVEALQAKLKTAQANITRKNQNIVRGSLRDVARHARLHSNLPLRLARRSPSRSRWKATRRT